MPPPMPRWGPSPRSRVGRESRRSSTQDQISVPQRREIGVHRRLGHLIEARRPPFRPPVLVDDRRAHPLVEVVAGHAGLGQAVFHAQYLGEADAGANLADADLALQIEVTAMHFDKKFGQRKAQTGTAASTGQLAIEATKKWDCQTKAS